MRLKALYKNRAILLDSVNTGDRYLVVSDLHIGFEERFRGTGIQIEPNIDRMTDELVKMIGTYQVTKLVINGDVKAGTDRILKSEWEYVPRFFSRVLKKCEVSVIPGNHDGGLDSLLPSNVEMLDISGVLIEDTLIMHGHTRPLIKFKDCRRIIVGHVHPIFQRKGNPLSGQPVWVVLRTRRKQIFKELLDAGLESDSLLEIILMPTFNPELSVSGFAYEEAKQERRVAPLIRELRGADEAIVVTLEGEVIGDASFLPDIL